MPQQQIPTDRDLVVGIHPSGNDFNWLAKRQLGNAIFTAAQRYATGRLVDIGCGEKPYRSVFAPYVTEHVGVDHPESPHALNSVDVLATAYRIPLADSSFETALMSELLEHLETPAKALGEAHRLLTPGGWLIATTPFVWALHEEPRDYFRYTPFALDFLFREAGFEEVEVTPVGGQWSTVGLLASYALRESPLRRFGDPARHIARWAQEIGARLDRRDFKPWMAWNHLAVGRKHTGA
jgi:ubiquinone/menaquinone biosynthesis C-methylase UbiE